MAKKLPSPQQVRKLLRYEPNTGKLFWRVRTPDMFSNSYRAADGNCRNWNSKHAGKEAFTSVSNGYLVGSVFGIKMKSHRVIWAYTYGAWPKNQIDHIDGNKSNNRIENLRDVSNLINHRNMKRSSLNTSGHTGVHRHQGKWRVKLGNKHIGVYKNLDQAVKARLKAEAENNFHKNHGRDHVR